MKGKNPMKQKKEMQDIRAEIAHLKEKLIKLYDESNKIDDKLLEVSAQLDQKINLYLKMNTAKQHHSGL